MLRVYFIKYIPFSIFLFAFYSLKGQSQFDSIKSKQPILLRQYLGFWESSITPDSDSLSEFPTIKMANRPKMETYSMVVDVSKKLEGAYIPILSEYIGYDKKSDSIVALGQNQLGEVFIGKGHFKSTDYWQMHDHDMFGEKVMEVQFDFKNQTDVLVEGVGPTGQVLWTTRYIKHNPKDKNIGIQLVSVHDQMLDDVETSLGFLDRMGYSFVETFVYKNRSFYGFTPEEFKKTVEKHHLKFKGSMTFYGLPDNTKKSWEDAIAWWEDCIEDHIEAGVEYLTTSNNQINKIESLDHLKRYCEYYNKIGQLCKEKGIKFAYHNHADEYRMLEGIRIYDYLLDNTDSNLVSFQADLYWMHSSGIDPNYYFKNHPGRFISWHVKDYAELGDSGKMDFSSYFNYKETSGLQYIVAEVEVFNHPVWYSVAQAWNYLYFKIL